MAAVFGALNVSALTSTLGCAVHDVVPQTPTFPYCRIDSPSGVSWDTFGAPGKRRSLWVHVFSTYAGGLQARQIVDQVIALLHDVALSVTGHVLCGLRYQQDVDGADENRGGVRVIHKVVMFDIHTQDA
jgi:hypothetical protein